MSNEIHIRVIDVTTRSSVVRADALSAPEHGCSESDVSVRSLVRIQPSGLEEIA